MEDNKPTAKKLGKTLGKSGTTIYRGIISNEDYNVQTVGKLGLKNFDIMRRSDSTVRSTLLVVKLPVRQVEWRIKPASDDENDLFQARHIENELFGKQRFEPLLKDGLTELDFGHCVIEKTFGLTTFEGKTLVGIEDLGYRKQTTIDAWEMNNGKPGIRQRTSDGHEADIPREKLMYFVFDQEGDNYYGTPLLRYAYRDWAMKDKLILINAIALDKGSIPIPVFDIPADASQSDKDAADEYARQFRANEEGYLRKPTGWGVEILDLKSNTVRDVLPTIKYHDRQIQLSVMAQFLATGTTESGARATSEDHTKLFLMSEEALAKQLRHVIQKELIEQLCDLNFSNMPNGYPQLEFGKIGDDNVTELGEYVNKLMSANAITYDPDLENHLRKVARLPELSEDVVALMKKNHIEELKNPQPKDSGVVDPKATKDMKTETALKQARQARENLIDVITG